MKRLYNQKGVTAIEFVSGALILFFTTFVIFESTYQIYVVNMTEYSLRETIRNTKIYEGKGVNEQYESKFKELIEHNDNLWSFLIEGSRFSIAGKYFKNYNDFIANEGHSDQGLNFNYDLAEITVTYRYTPMIKLTGTADRNISRTMVLNLEHEGWKDDAP
ncbi:TadE/TadG family type IV pilus assembly protein [Vibrio parahaemolyticus]|uniref:TadE/TadG family type IV pilus assembly protein n=1 Tax=Vibrio parahaemolyticus TaxID=670 RepID=UPI0003FE2DEC|nr:TadE family protein [Vibrio parahaemolyticus]EGR7950983.1 pilus assembly protein [Vibrio vulnificus]EGQ8926252.1 pilus assembly protein [Vibrio parahaemolyticus]EGR2948261.1 pilus assembly protein [Vibrio parahaemolyticus]EGR3067727.1 pilus assembly protein [Vibrio parahaemolyticus]EHH1218457.1 pilus assembly protein [Vibrio parahaemolyticus]